MRTVAVIAFLTLALEAQANLKMANVNKMVNPGVIGRPISSTPQQRFPYGVSALREFSPAFRNPVNSVPYSRMTIVGAETAEKEAAEKAAEDAGPKNVYGDKLQKCNSNEDCGYSAPASPQICATKVTRDYSPQEDTFKWAKNPGADVWKPDFAGSCITIWDVGAESGFFGQAGISWGEKEQGYGTQFGFVPTDYLVKCDALPTEVLTSSFSLEMFRSCYLESKKYKYVSKVSSMYKADSTETTIKDQFKIDKPSLNEEQPNALSGKCFRFRAAIENICQSCSEQTNKAGGKQTLEGFCSAIEGTQGMAEMAPDVLGLTTTFLVSLFAGSAITLVMSRFRRRVQTASEQPLLY